MNKQKLLLIEEDKEIELLIASEAKDAGYELVIETNEVDSLYVIEIEQPDLILLDITLSGQKGLDLCRKIKTNPEAHNIPLIIISNKHEEADILLGFELGADDYVTKPFSIKILFSRIRAILRRPKLYKETVYQIIFGPFRLELDKHQLYKENKPIILTLSEFNILSRLAQHRGKVLNRNQLLDEIQGTDSFIIDRNIDVHVASLRRKLGPDFDLIETVRGLGYRFKDDVT